MKSKAWETPEGVDGTDYFGRPKEVDSTNGHPATESRRTVRHRAEANPVGGDAARGLALRV
jgi:hypothetical protein